MLGLVSVEKRLFELILVSHWRSCVKCGPGELSPSLELFLQLLDCGVNLSFSVLDLVDLLDLGVVVDESNALSFHLGKLGHQVHGSSCLLDKLLIAERVKDLDLKRDDANHQAVEDLVAEVLLTEFHLLISLLGDVIIEVVGLILMVVPDFPEADVLEEHEVSIMNVNKWHLEDDLQKEVNAAVDQKPVRDYIDELPLLLFKLSLVILSLLVGLVLVVLLLDVLELNFLFPELLQKQLLLSDGVGYRGAHLAHEDTIAFVVLILLLNLFVSVIMVMVMLIIELSFDFF